MGKLSFSEMIASTLLFGVGLYTIWRGIYWLVSPSSVVQESDFYQSLNSVLPIGVWGISFVISGALLVVSSYLLPKRNQWRYWILCIGGFISFFMYLIITTASLYNAINWITPVQFATLSGMCLVISFFGGFELYGKRQ